MRRDAGLLAGFVGGFDLRRVDQPGVLRDRQRVEIRAQHQARAIAILHQPHHAIAAKVGRYLGPAAFSSAANRAEVCFSAKDNSGVWWKCL